MNPFLPESDNTPEKRPACAGKWWLFDSTLPADREEAARLCKNVCQVRGWCEQRKKEALTDPSYGLGVNGTWNAQLYKNGRRITVKRMRVG